MAMARNLVEAAVGLLAVVAVAAGAPGPARARAARIVTESAVASVVAEESAGLAGASAAELTLGGAEATRAGVDPPGNVVLAAATASIPVVEPGYRIFRPDGPGPHPAVVFMSGCSGLTPSFAPRSYERPAEELRKLGFVVVWVDYLGRRNLRSCAGGGVTQEEAGRDAVAAASWLRTRPYVDAKRIAAIGWSYGGGAVLAALSSHPADQLVFSRAVVYYPYCDSTVGSSPTRIPLLALRGSSDNVAPRRLCEPALGGSSGTANVRIIDYPEAQHAFDVSELPPRIEYQFGTLGYHPRAAAAAWDEVQRFLRPGA
jgi:dienelactone hydrolase